MRPGRAWATFITPLARLGGLNPHFSPVYFCSIEPVYCCISTRSIGHCNKGESSPNVARVHDFSILGERAFQHPVRGIRGDTVDKKTGHVHCMGASSTSCSTFANDLARLGCTNHCPSKWSFNNHLRDIIIAPMLLLPLRCHAITPDQK